MKALLLALMLAMPAVAWSWTGTVVGVHDGDSITVLQEGNQQVKIRLEGIDAPELKQPFGTAAKKALSDLVFEKAVSIEETGRDRYGRTLANVHVGKLWVNLALVEQGMAWHYIKYSRDERLQAAEQKARAGKAGLWQQKQPVAPWNARKKPKASM